MSSPAVIVVTEERLREILREERAETAALASREPEPLLVTCSVLCKRLGVSRATVYRWRQQEMPAVPCGDDFRYEVAAVMTWLRGGGAAK